MHLYIYIYIYMGKELTYNCLSVRSVRFCLLQVSTASTASVKYIIVTSDTVVLERGVRLQNSDCTIEPGP